MPPRVTPTDPAPIIMNGSDAPNRAKKGERLARALEMLGKCHSPITAREYAKRLALPLSQVHSLLSLLRRKGLARRTPGGLWYGQTMRVSDRGVGVLGSDSDSATDESAGVNTD